MGNTAQLRPASTTKLIHSFRHAIKAGQTLDSLKRAFVAAFKLCTSGECKLVALAKMALLAIRRSAATMFGSVEIGDSYLMGAY